MECLSEFATRYQEAVEAKSNGNITWILEQHAKASWLETNRPETKPVLRLYMRLVKQEAHKRGLRT